MCHIILFLPVLAMPIFWLLPLSLALPVYLVVMALSGWIYLSLMRSMRMPKIISAEALLNRRGDVIQVNGSSSLVRIQNELWKAISDDVLHCGDTVVVTDRDGLILHVSRLLSISISSSANQRGPRP